MHAGSVAPEETSVVKFVDRYLAAYARKQMPRAQGFKLLQNNPSAKR